MRGLLIFILPCCLWWFQRTLLYQTWLVEEHNLPPSAFNLPKGNSFHSFTRFYKPDANCTIYFYHGTGHSVTSSLWHISRLYHATSCAIMACEYPGYGEFAHLETTQQNILDMCKPLEREGRSEKKLYALGSSLGAAVVLHLAEHFDAIILENPFTSLSELTWMPNVLLFDQWDSLIMARRGTCPALVLISEKDKLVPPLMGVRIKKAMRNSSSEGFFLEGASHGHAAAHPDYLPRIAQFLKDR